MSDENKSLGIKFLLEEYKNIAATHDKLRDVVSRLFNYFLLLSAFPFTVAGIMFRNEKFDLLTAPGGLYMLFLIVGAGIYFLALAIVDARLRQYWYAKTVNLIRKYFVDNAPEIKSYLFLPVSTDYPKWRKLGFAGYQMNFMVLLGSFYTSYGITGLASPKWGLLSLLVYVVSYVIAYSLSLRKFETYRAPR